MNLMDGMLVNMTDWELLNLCFVKLNSENDVTWLTWLVEYLKFKYREFKISSSLELKHVGVLAQ